MNYKKKKTIMRIIMLVIAALMIVGISIGGLVSAFAAESVTVESFESGNLYNAFCEAKGETDQNNVKSFIVKTGTLSSADFSMFGNLSSCEIIDLSGAEFEGGKIPDNFMSGRRVTEFYAPKNITSIGNNAFSGCAGLKKLSFTDSLNTVGNRAFESCTALTTVVFPASLTFVDECAFRGSGLTDIYFYGNAPQVGSEAFPQSATVHITENASGFDSDEWNKYAIVKDVAENTSVQDTPEETTTFGATAEETTTPEETVTEAVYGAFAENETTVTESNKSDKTAAAVLIVIAAAVVILVVVAVAAIVAVKSKKPEESKSDEEPKE